MRIEFTLSKRVAPERFLGTRHRALAIRDELESLLAKHGEVVLDFSGVEATQSFLDELLGVLVLERGPDIVEQLVFRGCSEDVKETINFVLGDRIEQYKLNQVPH
jgi:anti-anti-sigma regulatory factor